LNAPAKTNGTKKPRSWLGLLIPAVLAFAVLVALGTWQIKRKAWKEGLIATLNQRLTAPPIALPPPATWPNLDQARYEYSRVKFSAQFESDKDALVYAVATVFRPDASGEGFWVFAPARLADGSLVVVNRGFVPKDLWNSNLRPEGETAGSVEITGVLRWPDEAHWFTPKPDAVHNLWFLRDPVTIAAAKGWAHVSPFYVEQETPVPPGGWPRPGKLVVSLPNNHLQYALTWYGLALVLVVMFAMYAFKSRREAR
jgi:surfeit locus 1 family protein